MSERVGIHIEDRIAQVQLTRGEKRNALDLAMFEALIEAGERIAADTSVRSVVLSGEGKAFCAGLDFGSFFSSPDAAQRLLTRGEESPANVAQRAAWVWQEVPVPVIAALHGPTFGGGLQIALGADIRYATPDAQLSVMEIKWGIIPDMSITQTVLRLLPLDVAKELTFTGKILSGSEAKDLGLVTHLSEDPVKDATALAQVIASKNPYAIRSAKLMYRECVEQSREAALKFETELQLALLGSPNQMEAVQANMEKRDPEFQDPK